MLFTSFHFLLIFLPVVLLVASFLRGQKLLQWIVLSSLAFYALEGQPWFLIPMCVTTVLDYAIAILLEEMRSKSRRKILLIVSLCGNVGMLFYYKYAGLFSSALLSVLPLHSTTERLAWLDIILPIGISFYTFQTLSYVIDVYRGQATAERNFWKFFSFVAFFPHLIAGPLTRHHQLLPALDKISREGIEPRWEEGVFLFAVGFCKKILLADRFGQLVDLTLNDTAPATMLAAWATVFGYGFQIYFDFSGYSDMAIGLGRLFGIELPQNFNSPYKALNPRDFWSRWHITLSNWMRDYLYIPLGGNQGGPLYQARNLSITMFLGGLWHGAKWTFALWGVYQGLLLILYHSFKRYWDRWPVVIQRVLTFILISLGWIFFRSTTYKMALSWWKSAFQWKPLAIQDFSLTPIWFLGLALGFFIVNTFPNASSFQRFKRLDTGLQIALGCLCVLAILYINYSSRFLYYQF